jgi:hypothetical protein
LFCVLCFGLILMILLILLILLILFYFLMALSLTISVDWKAARVLMAVGLSSALPKSLV